MTSKIQYKIGLLIATFLLMTGCFGSDGNGTDIDTTGKVSYETANFSILVPQDWEILEKNSFPSNVPSNTEVAFRNNIKSEVFTANVNIALGGVNEGVNSFDFGKSSLSNAKSSLLSYEEIGSRDHLVPAGDGNIETLVFEFQGKKSAAEPIVKFQQLYAVMGGNSYTVTAAYLPNEDESVVKMMEEMLNSFSLN